MGDLSEAEETKLTLNPHLDVLALHPWPSAPSVLPESLAAMLIDLHIHWVPQSFTRADDEGKSSLLISLSLSHLCSAISLVLTRLDVV